MPVIFFTHIKVANRRLWQLSAVCLGLWLGACANNQPEEPLLETGASSVSKSRQQQWLCKSDGQRGWDCRDQATGFAEPPAAIMEQQSATRQQPSATTPAPVAAVVPPPPRNITQMLLDAPPGAVVIQLIAASQQATLDRFRAARPELPCDQVTIKHGGRRQLLLVMGPYPTAEEAESVIEVFAPFNEQPWVRPVAALRAGLQQ